MENEQYQNEKMEFAGFKSGDLVYEGAITKELNQNVFEAFRNADTKPKKLMISSPGGEIGLGMELGEWVREHNLDIEVANLCASSCANYVFTAANLESSNPSEVSLIWGRMAKEIEIKSRSYVNRYLSSSMEIGSVLFDRKRQIRWAGFKGLEQINSLGLILK